LLTNPSAFVPRSGWISDFNVAFIFSSVIRLIVVIWVGPVPLVTLEVVEPAQSQPLLSLNGTHVGRAGGILDRILIAGVARWNIHTSVACFFCGLTGHHVAVCTDAPSSRR
jgi:hypothetical protein